MATLTLWGSSQQRTLSLIMWWWEKSEEIIHMLVYFMSFSLLKALKELWTNNKSFISCSPLSHWVSKNLTKNKKKAFLHSFLYNPRLNSMEAHWILTKYRVQLGMFVKNLGVVEKFYNLSLHRFSFGFYYLTFFSLSSTDI